MKSPILLTKVFNRLFKSNNKPKYLCLNFAKTAGTSLSQLLMDTFKPGEITTTYGPTAIYDQFGHLEPNYFLHFLSKFNKHEIFVAKAFLGHLPFIDKSLFKFPVEYIVFFRNPIERIVSGYTYGLKNQRIPQDIFEFWLHTACSNENSSGFSNSLMKTLLHKTVIDPNDTLKINGLIESIGFIGITEAFEDSCQNLLRYLGKSSKKIYHLNTSKKFKSLPASTMQTIKYRNSYDILLYNQACEVVNTQRISARLPPLPLCDYVSEGSFSSGDYHPELSCHAAFDSKANSAWVSSYGLLPTTNEYLGYDFGANQKIAVHEIRIQIISTPPSIIHYALEVSNDGFIDDVQTITTFEVAIDDRIQMILTGVTYYSRMWRIRRISDLNHCSVAISTLSFTPEQESICKDIELIKVKINLIMKKYNIGTFSKTYDEVNVL